MFLHYYHCQSESSCSEFSLFQVKFHGQDCSLQSFLLVHGFLDDCHSFLYYHFLVALILHYDLRLQTSFPLMCGIYNFSINKKWWPEIRFLFYHDGITVARVLVNFLIFVYKVRFLHNQRDEFWERTKICFNELKIFVYQRKKQKTLFFVVWIIQFFLISMKIFEVGGG